jgi:hypothetical protein
MLVIAFPLYSADEPVEKWSEKSRSGSPIFIPIKEHLEGRRAGMWKTFSTTNIVIILASA